MPRMKSSVKVSMFKVRDIYYIGHLYFENVSSLPTKILDVSNLTNLLSEQQIMSCTMQ